jgi:hypothetical protein
MARWRERVRLEDGLKLDLNRLIRRNFVRPGLGIGRNNPLDLASGSMSTMRDQPCGMISCSKGVTAIIAFSGGSPRLDGLHAPAGIAKALH